LTRALFRLLSGAYEQARPARNPLSSCADRRSLLPDVTPSSQTRPRAGIDRADDGPPSGNGVAVRCRTRRPDRGAAGPSGCSSAPERSQACEHRRARCADRPRGGRHAVSLGRRVAGKWLRLLRARALGVRQARNRRPAQLVCPLEHRATRRAHQCGGRRRPRFQRPRARGALPRPRPHGARASIRENRRGRRPLEHELRLTPRRCAARHRRVDPTVAGRPR
jgi:hypothetical protein